MNVTTLLLVLLAGAATPVAADGVEIPRIRADGPYERQLLARGQCSLTFQRLVAEVSASELIVYVSVRRLANPALAGGLQFVSASDGARILRIVLDIDIDRNRMVARLGHELQHAMEVAGAPEIRTRAGLEAFYQRHGVESRVANGHDTTKAREIERVIRAELRKDANCQE